MSIKHGRTRGLPLHLTGEGKESRPAYRAGKIYPVDSAAAERLKEIVAQQAKPTTLKEKAVMMKGKNSKTPGTNGVTILSVEMDVEPPPVKPTGESKYDPVVRQIFAAPPGKWVCFTFEGVKTANNAFTHLRKLSSRLHGKSLDVRTRTDKGNDTSSVYVLWVEAEDEQKN